MSPVTVDIVRAKLRNATEAAAQAARPHETGRDSPLRAPFSLNPCLTEPALQAHEAEHGITLPDAYRQFLLEVGNGGCGPLLGLYSLEESLHRTSAPPHRRFPWMHDPDAPRKRLTAYEPGEGFAHLEEFEDSAIEPDLNGGYLQLGGEYGTEAWLVITGRERGRVWYSEFIADSDTWPSGLGFLEWYDRWLDMALQQLQEEGKRFQRFHAYTPHSRTSAPVPESLDDIVVLALSRALFQKDFAAAVRVLNTFQDEADTPGLESLMKAYLKVGTGCLKHQAPELAVQCFEKALDWHRSITNGCEDLEPFIQPRRSTLLEALALAHERLARP